jgi:hypothetical protein
MVSPAMAAVFVQRCVATSTVLCLICNSSCLAADPTILSISPPTVYANGDGNGAASVVTINGYFWGFPQGTVFAGASALTLASQWQYCAGSTTRFCVSVCEPFVVHAASAIRLTAPALFR